ncbi:hypothetical protein MTX78_13055 [Hymenobacter tibetensis]|uniref:Lipoyl-binding domain-containing protein n=1 Tax=Hymenobacter tibetensis TaxID=497967 RepID=A0ABY4CS44_9BACT|nr:hypothetical protein [Hymenobacter tibetensis]UOG73054.1 hypothetical protein MTX78_13055 [Hymenobacter tibetensis]
MAFKRGVFFSLAFSAVLLLQTSTRPAPRDGDAPTLPASFTSNSVALPSQPALTAQQPDSLRPILAGARGHVIQLFFGAGQPVQAGQILAKVSEEIVGSSRYTIAFVVAPTAGVMAETHLQPGDFHHPKTVLALLRIPTDTLSKSH